MFIGDGMAHDIYISYSKNDEDAAFQISNQYEMNNFKCWIFPRDVISEKSLIEEIDEAIVSAKLFVLVFSKNSNRSEFQKHDVLTAFMHYKPIVACMMDDSIPEAEFAYCLKNVQFINACPLNDSVYNHLFECASELDDSIKIDGLYDGVEKQFSEASSSEIYESNNSIYLSYDESDIHETARFNEYCLTDNIDESSLLVVLLSKKSLKSCMKDIEMAFSRDIPVILIFLEDVKLKFGLKSKLKYKSKIDDLSYYSIKRYLLEDSLYVESYRRLFDEFQI